MAIVTGEAERNVGGNEGHFCLGILRVENRRKDIPGRGNSLCKASGVKDVGFLEGRRKVGCG